MILTSKSQTIRLILIMLFFFNNNFAQQTGLPFENNKISVEKIMAGMVALAVYFIPTLISRDKIHFRFIFLFNALLGWTVIGWFISFLWALWAKSKNTTLLSEDIDD
ncbi:superinfection immunity protein [Flavobacterium difficile]|uniref:Superinfection immunity protein n=1 Tax=Flavobacterium difficile TaxID=2709659 RepID=A0ABX0I602_9FLAO|nr:superinfection immunity protein [Flavobacterium difficile]NHM02557.1 superinfection immunity protein [Flavobacterium difficile]